MFQLITGMYFFVRLQSCLLRIYSYMKREKNSNLLWMWSKDINWQTRRHTNRVWPDRVTPMILQAAQTLPDSQMVWGGAGDILRFHCRFPGESKLQNTGPLGKKCLWSGYQPIKPLNHIPSSFFESSSRVAGLWAAEPLLPFTLKLLPSLTSHFSTRILSQTCMALYSIVQL